MNDVAASATNYVYCIYVARTNENDLTRALGQLM